MQEGRQKVNEVSSPDILNLLLMDVNYGQITLTLQTFIKFSAPTFLAECNKSELPSKN